MFNVIDYLKNDYIKVGKYRVIPFSISWFFIKITKAILPIITLVVFTLIALGI